MIPEPDPYELEILSAYESGRLKASASKAERLRDAARATAVKDRRVDIRLSPADLQGLQARALEEGLPYQTLIASVLHKYLTGRLSEGEPSASGAPGADPGRNVPLDCLRLPIDAAPVVVNRRALPRDRHVRQPAMPMLSN